MVLVAGRLVVTHLVIAKAFGTATTAGATAARQDDRFPDVVHLFRAVVLQFAVHQSVLVNGRVAVDLPRQVEGVDRQTHRFALEDGTAWAS